MTDLYLYVDNEDSTGTWSTTGSAPYLSTQDQPNNYIYSTSRNANSGVYSFPSSGKSSETINSVTLYIYAYGVSTSDFEAILSSSATGLGPPAGSWQWVSIDVSSILTTWAQIDAATVYFDRPNTQNDAGVDCCYLLVDYTGGTDTSDNQGAYLKGSQDTDDNQTAYTKGISTLQTGNKAAYLKGQSTLQTSNKGAFLKGSQDTTSSASAFLKGPTASTTDPSVTWAFVSTPITYSNAASDSHAAFLYGQVDIADSKSAYLEGVPSRSSHAAYLKGKATATDSRGAYLKGSSDASDNQNAYTNGVVSTSSNKSAYMRGQIHLSTGYTSKAISAANYNGIQKRDGADCVAGPGDVWHSPGGSAGSTYVSGWVFTNIQIPDGVRITSAYLHGRVPSSIYDDMCADVHGEAHDNPGVFVAYTRCPYWHQNLTSASVYWVYQNNGSGWKTSPNIAAPVQEVVNRPGWTSGNNLGLQIRGRIAGAVQGAGNFDSYQDGNPGWIEISWAYAVPAYLKGSADVSSSQSAYLSGGISSSDTQSAYLEGRLDASDSQPAYTGGISDLNSSSQDAYLCGGINVTSSKDAFLEGQIFVSSSQAAILVAGNEATDNKNAYLKGQDTATDSRSAFLKGALSVSTSKGAYLEGQTYSTSSHSAYLSGAESTSSHAAYLKGQDTATTSKDSFLKGSQTASDSKGAFLKGQNVASDSIHAFMLCGSTASSSKSAYLDGIGEATSSVHAFTFSGYQATPSAQSAYTHGSKIRMSSRHACVVAATISSVPAYILGGIADNQNAYLAGHQLVHNQRHAYLMCGTGSSSSKSAYTTGVALVRDYQAAYLRGQQSATSSKSAYLKAGTAASNSHNAYLNGIPQKVSSRHAYLEGGTAYKTDSHAAYLAGIPEAKYWISAYLAGHIAVTSSVGAFLEGCINDSASAYMLGGIGTSVHAYLSSVGYPTSSHSAYTLGIESGEVTTFRGAYLKGVSGKIVSSKAAYLTGIARSQAPAYTEGAGTDASTSHSAYIHGQGDGKTSEWDETLHNFDTIFWMRGALIATPSNVHAYLNGNVIAQSSHGAFCRGIVENARSSVHAFIGAPVYRSSISCYTEGLMAEYPYIILETSNASISERFRVVAQGYDDGSLEKSASINKTIGGGVDVSMGETYTTWNPIIRVRHTETESNYGDLSDLETLYKLSDPGGTPTNVITFTDNHGVGHSVYMLGSFRKQYIGAHVEGDQAWLFVKLQLVEKT